MKNFFLVLFGGLFILLVCLGVARIMGVSGYGSPSLAASVSAISENFSAKTQVYTAEEEEGSFERAIHESSDASSEPTAFSFVVRDLSTGQVVFSRNEDKIMPIASLAKLVTAVMARRLIPNDSKIKIIEGVVDTYGNTANLKIGETLTAKDLLYPLLMVSSNDAAEAIAAHYGRKKFIQAMNDFAQEIGAYRTYFADPAGLSPYTMSTSYDVALILDWIKKNDEGILEVTKEKSRTLRAHTWLNPTRFLAWSNYIGGKNGYTPEADRTGASIFSIGPLDKLYAIVVLKSKDRDGDVMKLLSMI